MADAGAEISAVSETLFLPLYSLALESQRKNPVMVDAEAVALTLELNSYFASSDKKLFQRLAAGKLPGTLLTSMSLRIRQFDRYVSQFLERVPDGIVVNLGCGLNDRRRRVDNGTARFYDLDLPEVIALRRKFLPESDRMRFIACSVLDPGWLDELPDEPGDRFLFVAEGLFMYLPPEGVRALVVGLRERFGGCQLIAEFASEWAVRMLNSPWGRGKYRRQFSLSENVTYAFGIDDPLELEGWAPGIEYLDRWTYFDEDEPRLAMYGWFVKSPRVRYIQYTARFLLGDVSRDEAYRSVAENAETPGAGVGGYTQGT